MRGRATVTPKGSGALRLIRWIPPPVPEGPDLGIQRESVGYGRTPEGQRRFPADSGHSFPSRSEDRSVPLQPGAIPSRRSLTATASPESSAVSPAIDSPSPGPKALRIIAARCCGRSGFPVGFRRTRPSFHRVLPRLPEGFHGRDRLYPPSPEGFGGGFRPDAPVFQSGSEEPVLPSVAFRPSFRRPKASVFRAGSAVLGPKASVPASGARQCLCFWAPKDPSTRTRRPDGYERVRRRERSQRESATRRGGRNRCAAASPEGFAAPVPHLPFPFAPEGLNVSGRHICAARLPPEARRPPEPAPLRKESPRRCRCGHMADTAGTDPAQASAPEGTRCPESIPDCECVHACFPLRTEALRIR